MRIVLVHTFGSVPEGTCRNTYGKVVSLIEYFPIIIIIIMILRLFRCEGMENPFLVVDANLLVPLELVG